jgi:rod shape determining protein RodA
MRLLLRKIARLGSAFPILLVLALLCLASIFIIISATYTNDALKDAYSSQSRYLIIGAAVFVALALIPYQALVRISPTLYGLAVILLVAVYVPHLGRKVFGAYSWLRLGPISFEPAEFAKLAFVLSLAWLLKIRESKIQHLSTVLIAVAVPRFLFSSCSSSPPSAPLGLFPGLLRHAFRRRRAAPLHPHSAGGWSPA